MAKSKKKEKGKRVDSMEISTSIDLSSVQVAMDISEEKTPSSNLSANRKINKKSMQLKRGKKLRKKKAIARAITCSDKSEVKISKQADKKSRLQSSKSLYE